MNDCIWDEDPDDGNWASSCGQTFEFYDGGPEDNSFKFCPYCGDKLKEVFYEEEEGDE